MNFKKLTSLALMTCLSILLSSCATTQYLASKTAPNNLDSLTQTKTQTLVSDVLVAIGKPTQKVQNYEDSLVLVGKNHSYFIEPNSNDKKLFQQIFSQVDLSNIYINQQDINAEIQSSCRYKHGCGTVELSFRKEKAKLLANEEKTVKKLGFQCHEQTITAKNYLTCNNKVAIGYTVISQVKNVHSLQHRFKKAVNLTIVKKTNLKNQSVKKTGKQAVYYTLYPVAVVIDIVTFPIQAILGLATIDGSDWN